MSKTQDAKLRLTWFVIASLFVLVMIIWRGGDFLKQQKLQALQQDASIQLDQLGEVLENAITKYQHMPALLASKDRVRKALREGLVSDINQLNRELDQINRITEASNSYILDKHGYTIAASNYAMQGSFVGKNFAFRPYFKQAIEGSLGRYYALGTTSNRRGYFFSYPVYDGNAIVGVAVVKIELEPFEERFSNQGYEFLLLDPDQVVFGSSRPEWLYKTMEPLSHKELERIANSKRYKDQQLFKLPILNVKEFDKQSRVVEFLKASISSKHEDRFERVGYLEMRRPIRLLGFQIASLSPLNPINDSVFLWRMFVIGSVTIIVLITGLAFSRRRMLKERLVANEMSRHNDAYIRAIIQNTQAGLVTLDQDKRIESFNPAIESLAGHSLLPFIGQKLDSLYQKDVSSEIEKSIQFTSDKDELNFTTTEGVLRCEGDTPKAVEMNLCLIELPHQRKYLVTFHDMTERKRYEREITQSRTALEVRVKERTFELEEANHRLRKEIDKHKETQRELIQTAKLAVLGQLSAGINHELNQPLTAMRAFSENALTFLKRNNLPSVEKNLLQINSLSQHMGDIVARLKVFARKGEVQQGAVPLQQTILAAVSIIESRLKDRGIALIVPEDHAVSVKADRVFLEQVLVNLLSNAVDAVTENKEVEPSIMISVYPVDRQRIVVKVSDSGHGLTAEARKHLFEPFYTSKPHGAGLGLGLSISQRIIESMNGKIYANTNTESGAEFSIELLLYSSVEDE
ncbi:ATP-binding protein [Marinomonas sp. 2405UD68-3]|uniref:ATP-binding protein n=1 Tax=Marinomonas sp. 2405UD68-3 TaxID=3391835 RepID=UPI0039C91049